MKQSYYTQVALAAFGYVECYIRDITKHDRRGLNGFTGEFIYAMRPTGTNLLKFGGSHAAVGRIAEIIEHFVFQANTRFFHGINGGLYEVSEQHARQIYEDAVLNGEKFYE